MDNYSRGWIKNHVEGLTRLRFNKGKFTLDGKVIEAEIVKVSIVGYGNNKPKKADAYYVGQTLTNRCYNYHPVVYLKIRK